MEVVIPRVKDRFKSVALIVAFVLSLIAVFVGPLIWTGTTVGAEVQSVRPLAKPCKTVPAAKWNRWRAREIAADGRSRQKKSKPVCIHTFRKFKRHVLKVERGPCWKKGVKCWIRVAARKYNQPIGDAMRVADCESDFRPWLVNSTPVGSEHASGLFQFLPSTWATTPYAHRDIFSAKWNSLAAMWMWSVGRRGEWACQ